MWVEGQRQRRQGRKPIFSKQEDLCKKVSELALQGIFGSYSDEINKGQIVM